MISLKTLIVLCTILAVCYCQSHHFNHALKRKKHKFKRHAFSLFWLKLHYLVFLALKVKAVLVLGSIFTIGLLAGKVFAAFKFSEYMKKKHLFEDNDDIDHHEKIVFMNPHSSVYDYHGGDSYPSSGPIYSKSYGDSGGSYQDIYPPGFSLDQPPPDAQIDGGNVGGGGPYNGPSAGGQSFGVSAPGHGYGPRNGYGRSENNKEGSSYYENFTTIIRRSNITDKAFDDMNIKSNICRTKFICEADFNAKDSIILKTALDWLSDESYLKYKTYKNITSIDECGSLYPCQAETNM